MPRKTYFSYIRVSTQRQGQTGTSLAEQQASIERYARSWDLKIVKRFEERETAARQGRPVFLEMLKALRRGKADGVIIHKIDRSARNLKDWADLGSLVDAGMEVHFAGESLDLSSRGGRLSADIQAVVASDYIRNLREETKKGIYGRLRQGLYPFPAVTGYKDCGKGLPKKPDPAQAKLIKRAFELYSDGNWGLIALAEKLYQMGLRNRNGRKITINGLSTILHNPFYMGLIRIEKTGEFFSGIHRPIISKKLFDKVQMVLAGKNIKKQNRHFFTFRRKIRCRDCQNRLIPERQKGNVYYRCHTKGCQKHTLKEEKVEKELLKLFKKMRLTDEEYDLLWNEAVKEEKTLKSEIEAGYQQLILRQNLIKDRISRLADGYMDGVFDKESYLAKKNELILEKKTIKEKLSLLDKSNEQILLRFESFLELANSAYLSYQSAKPEDRRELVEILTSNFTGFGKSVLVTLEKPFQIVAERPVFTAGSPHRETTRTLVELFNRLFECFVNLDITKSDDGFSNFINSKERGNQKIGFSQVVKFECLDGKV